MKQFRIRGKRSILSIMDLSLILMAMLLVTHIEGFNLNKNYSILMKGPEKSKFGYSVALWQDMTGVKRMVIGAPRGSHHPELGENEYNLGNIYFCNITGKCQPHKDVPFFKTNLPKQDVLTYGFTLRKYGIGFGESLTSLKDRNSSLAACAPRYVLKRIYELQARGACYILPDTSKKAKIQILKEQINLPLETYNNAMMGFSAALIGDNPPSLVLGGPMGFRAEGLVANKPWKGKSRGTISRIKNQKVVNKTLTDTYEGWQVAQGKFDGENISIVASAVNFANRGKVKFYPKEIETLARNPKNTLKEIEGIEIGGKFGYSLAVGDFDGDGVDDLLVGSPWSYIKKKQRLLQDVGKVFIYYSPLLKVNKHQTPLLGEEQWGRFGLSVTSIGDINRDKYDDVAIAAPYAGPNGCGVVYIYNGSPEGIIPKPSQTLFGSDFSSSIQGFGFSLDGGIDMDNNDYPDILIGAVESSKAVLLRSAPVVTLIGSVSFQTDAVKVDDKGCVLEKAGYKKVKGVCFDVDVNIRYKSDTLNTPLNMRLRMELKDQQDLPVFVFKVTNSPIYNKVVTIRSVDDKLIKTGERIFAKSDRSVIGKPVKVSVTASLEPSSVNDVEPQRAPVPPVLDILSETSFNTSAILTCDGNATCFSKPDMSILAYPTKLTIGEGLFELIVHLEVRNDPGYEVEVTVKHPSGIKYQRVMSDKIIPECRYNNLVGMAIHTKFTCKFPLIEADEKVNFTLIFEPKALELMDYLSTTSTDSISINLMVHSDSKDTDESDNKFESSVRVLTKATIHPKGNSHPEAMAVKVNQSLSVEDIDSILSIQNKSSPVQRLGPKITQYFYLTNKGPSPVMGAKVKLQLPLFRGNQTILYLHGKQHTSDTVTCNWPQSNPWGLTSFDRDGNSTDQEQGLKERRRKRQIKEDTLTQEFTSQSSMLIEETTERWTMTNHSETKTHSDYDYFENTIPRSNSPKPRTARAFSIPAGTEVIECLTEECTIICDVSLLKVDEPAYVSITGHLVIATLDQYSYNHLGIRSKISTEVNQKGSNVINPIIYATSYVTLLKPPESGLKAVPVWLLVLAVIGSMLVILIIMAVLWKMGFFKRNRPDAKHRSIINSEYPTPEKDPKETEPMQSQDDLD